MRAKRKQTFESQQNEGAQITNELESDIAMVMNLESLAIEVSDVDWTRLAACHPRAPTVLWPTGLQPLAAPKVDSNRHLRLGLVAPGRSGYQCTGGVL
jgi:hypothetical protein